MPEKRKPLHREGFLKENFKEFRARAEGYERCSVRCAVGADAEICEALEGAGFRHRLVEDHRGDMFLAVYTVRVGNAVHVSRAFQKKSKSCIATLQPDVELIEK